MESLASTTSRGEMYEACKPSECRSSYTDHFDSNFNSVIKKLFDLVDWIVSMTSDRTRKLKEKVEIQVIN